MKRTRLRYFLLCSCPRLLLDTLAVLFELAVISRHVLVSVSVLVFACTLGANSGRRCRRNGLGRWALDVNGSELIVLIVLVFILLVIIRVVLNICRH